MSSHRPILLVEDDPSDVDLTRWALSKGRISNELVVVESGQEALDYLRGEGAYSSRNISQIPALVLLDLKLPVVPGLEVLRVIRADVRIRRVLVVILTSSKEEEDINAGYELGVNSYVRKPVDMKEFQRAIETLGLYWLHINEPSPSVK